MCQVKSPTGTSQAGVPMLAPKVKRCVNRRKNSTYHESFVCAIDSCVNAGSESMKARRGMAAYSSRQDQEPPDRLM